VQQHDTDINTSRRLCSHSVKQTIETIKTILTILTILTTFGTITAPTSN
jgi:hypothetical protein